MKNFSLAALLILSSGALATPVWSQLEPIGPLVLQPQQVFTANYSNVLPPVPDYKELQFTGTASIPMVGGAAPLDIKFDYVTPNGNTIVVPAPNSPIFIFFGGAMTFDSGVLRLPFCPQVVSLHLSNQENNIGIPISLQGTFRHECFPVPEPSAIASVGLACLVMAVRARTRQVRA